MPSARSILYVGAGTPWAGGAGYLVRQWMFLRALGECGALKLVLFDDGRDVDAAKCPLPQAEVVRVASPRGAAEGKLRRAVADLISPLPRRARVAGLRAIRAAVRPFLRQSFDAVFAYRIELAWLAGALDDSRLLLDVDDPEHVRAARGAGLSESARTGLDWRTRWDLQKLRRFECRAVAGARAAFVCQPEDQRVFPPPRPIVIPNCVHVPAERLPRAGRPARLVFVGNFAGGTAAPNGDGLVWLLDAIWPQIRRANPQAELALVGQMSADLAERVRGVDGVRALGFVADLRAVYADAAASLAPLRFGTGTRIKILEALAHGCPVVTTTLGGEGLQLTDGREALIADEPGAFAAACLGLLADASLQERLSAAGHAHAQVNFDLERRHGALVALLRRLLDRPATAPLTACVEPT